jgi:hypothetical protein
VNRMPSKPARMDEVEPHLTYRQALFVSFYLGEANGNATEAARMAGYAKAKQSGSANLRKSQIRAALDSRLDEVAMSTDEVLARLTEVARADLGDFLKFDRRGRIYLDLNRAHIEGRLHLVKKLNRTQFGYVIELHDSMAALQLLGKYHGLFRDRIDLHGVEGLTDEELIQRVRELIPPHAIALPDPSPGR